MHGDVPTTRFCAQSYHVTKTKKPECLYLLLYLLCFYPAHQTADLRHFGLSTVTLDSFWRGKCISLAHRSTLRLGSTSLPKGWTMILFGWVFETSDQIRDLPGKCAILAKDSSAKNLGLAEIHQEISLGLFLIDEKGALVTWQLVPKSCLQSLILCSLFTTQNTESPFNSRHVTTKPCCLSLLFTFWKNCMLVDLKKSKNVAGANIIKLDKTPQDPKIAQNLWQLNWFSKKTLLANYIFLWRGWCEGPKLVAIVNYVLLAKPSYSKSPSTLARSDNFFLSEDTTHSFAACTLSQSSVTSSF